MDLGEEVILTLLWQSGDSESATVCFVIGLRICSWLLKYGALHVSVCARSRVWERETWSHNHDLCANIYNLHHCVCHVTLFQFRPWTDGKNKDNNNCLYIYFKAKSHDYGKGRYISESCLWCSANHNALCQLANPSRLCLLEGGTL